MKAITNDYKTIIKEMGREIDSKITYTDGSVIELGADDLNSITLHYEGGILKSVMKQLDIDSNVDIPLNTILECQFGVKVNGVYEYISLGNFVVYSSEKQEDLKSYKITCYDKLLYSMVDYEDMEIAYPITIRSYIDTICTHLGLTFANANDTFPNYDKEIQNELYLDNNNQSLGYTFRDVLDELSQVTASTICINDDDELEVRYINEYTGKNLCDVNLLYGNSTYYSINSDNEVTLINADTRSFNGLDGTTWGQYFPSGSYTISFNSNSHGNLQIWEKDVGQILTNIPLSNGYVNFTLTTGGIIGIKFIGLSSYLPYNVGHVMINKGNSALPYEPYTGGVDQIDEEYFKDINVNFGEVYGPINTITFKRGADSDIVSLSEPVNLPDEDKIEIAISENQILNGDDRADYLEDILNQLYGLTYSINDFTSTGITFYELCDKYNASIDGNIYTCIMFNDEINITQGLQEIVHTEIPEESKTDYNTTSRDDRTRLRTSLIVNKQEGTITGLVSSQDSLAQRVSSAETTLDSQGARLDIATTNIDPVTGDILALKRTNYEFGANGIIIDDEQGFKSVKNTTGDYYYENDTMIGKYTKDGSVQKDIALFGRYYYGIDENLDVENFTKDDAMFVGQLYEDNNNEQAFGHFYNGGN